MTAPELGRLEKVRLREVWPFEDRSFTPWLAQPENIELLSSTLGIELEVQHQEAAVGPYRADLLCKSTMEDHLVLIENQLEKTDHGHLGQLLTYAAGLHAVTIVWIAERFVDEHRAALDWLNEITDPSVNFFGLEIELWRIGTSPVAPKFNVVSKPNDWAKTLRSTTSGPKRELTPTQELQLAFWRAFADYLDERDLLPRRTKPQPQNWHNFAIGRSHFVLTATVDSASHVIRVRLTVGGPLGKAHYYLLEQRKEQVEQALGYPVIWYENPGKVESGLILETGGKLADQEDWPRQFDWLSHHLQNFHGKLGPLIRQLDANDYVEARDAEA